MRIHFGGAGQCAEYVSRRLIREGHDLVLMDRDEERCRELEQTLDARVLAGDSSRIADWQRADLASTDLFVACTHSDEHNVLACLIANELAPNALKAIRLRTDEYEGWGRMLTDLGVRVDRVVHPEIDILQRVLRVISLPGVSDIRNFADERVSVFSMNVEADNPLAGRSPGAARASGLLPNARVCLLFRDARVILPAPDEVLLPGDHAYLVTPSGALDETLTALGINRRERLKQVFIVGGGEIALELARALEGLRIPTKLFEQNPRRCEFLADQLGSTTIINADGTDQRILMGENIEGVNAFLSLTGNDDANLIAALLAKRMGADKAIPLLHRLNYLPLAQRLGINTSASPRVKAADALFEFIRGRGVLSVRTLGEEAAEAIELEVPEGSGYEGRSLGDIGLPAGVLVGALARPGEPAVLPDPDTVIQAGDRVIFFALEDAVKALEARILNGDSGSRRRA